MQQPIFNGMDNNYWGLGNYWNIIVAFDFSLLGFLRQPQPTAIFLASDVRRQTSDQSNKRYFRYFRIPYS